ncbi:MAG: bifunctional homocysteine S-methyltransferase/methylenetetrahydrofolate reductase [Oscillospiraceae bacterium]|nr:bifunctional homocysteine S-methyltransferase/methylenetetrahydrofolate reductase [Oscillospiraceae bacterium]
MNLLFDGAFGTYYIAQTNDHEPCECANLNKPDAALNIHRTYIAAGANAIKTNTFATTDNEVIARGFALAKQAAGTSAQVFASIGPKVDSEQYLAVAEQFIKLGATQFLFETQATFEPLLPALQAIHAQVKDATVIVSFAVSRDGFTPSGQAYKPLMTQAAASPYVSAVGLNCVCGPAHMLELVRQLPPLAKPLAAMPNSGYSTVVNGRTVYHNNAQYFAEKLLEIKQAGASILGGCCGTTPEHIKAIAMGASTQPVKIATPADISTPQLNLARKPIAVELDPPMDCDTDFILQAAQQLKLAGVNTITVADSPMAKTRADSFLTAALIKRDTGIDVLPHLTCRDKNFIAIKAALLGAGFYGIDKVLAITGDPVVHAENYRNPGVFNFNSKQLIGYIANLNREVFAGREFAIGGALNVNAPQFSKELARAKDKVAAGASFLYTQPLFSTQSIENFKLAKQELDCKLFAGILPVVSYKNAVFLNNEVAGIDVPQDVVDALQDKAPPQTREISIAFCQQVMREVYDHADGFYFITPMKKVDLICDLIERSFA